MLSSQYFSDFYAVLWDSTSVTLFNGWILSYTCDPVMYELFDFDGNRCENCHNDTAFTRHDVAKAMASCSKATKRILEPVLYVADY